MGMTSGKYRAWETRRQNEERVRQSLPADLLPLFDRIKNQGPLGETQRRVEFVLEYAEAHEDEVVAALQDEADEKLEAMIADYQGGE